MNKRLILAMASVCAAILALPAIASAGTWHAEPSTAATPFTTTTAGHGNVLLVTPNRTTTCNAAPSSTGSGSVNVGGTTGTISLKFHHCESLGTTCTTPGQPIGTIVTSPNLVFHNILIEKNTPGILLTGVGASTQIMHYTCGFELVTLNVTGGVIGHVEQACGTKGKKFSLNFEAPGGNQKFTQETTTGSKTDLTATVNGTPETGGLTGTFTMEFGAVERTITCT